MNIKQTGFIPKGLALAPLNWLALLIALTSFSLQVSAAESVVVNHAEATPIVYGKVIRADAIVELVREPTGRELCYDAPRPRTSKAPVVLGGILGGLVGNQFGSGNGRTATTIAGAAVGATLGAKHARKNTERYRGERRCEISEEYREYERVTGYRVTYELEGQQYVTRTQHHPGDELAIEVDGTDS